MKNNKENNNLAGGIFGSIEKIGNSLPHPAIIFFLLSILVVIVSHFAATYGSPVRYFDAREGKEVTVKALSLLNRDGFAYIFNSATDNFTGFAPLGTVLVAMLGVGVAEWTGLFDTSLKKLLSNVKPKVLTILVVFTGIISNIASDAGYVVVIPLGGLLFASAGRNPIAGIAAAFAGVSGGFSANLIIGSTDALLAGITNEALSSVGITDKIAPTANLYFLIASTFVLTLIGSFVTNKIVEKNLGSYQGSYVADTKPVSDLEKKGLRRALFSLIVYIIVLVFLLAPSWAPLRTLDEKTGVYTLDAFMHSGLMPAILLLFLIPGFVYGRTIGKIKNSHDLIQGMTEAMKSMGGYMVLAFFASQFVSYFGKTNLGLILSIKGATFLESIGLTGLPLIILFIIISGFLNLFMGSASAKWAIMAPIFVPMMYNIGLSPALTQVAYRIGDSSTNIITPLMNYFPMIVVFMQKYDKKSGLGTLISTMLPYSIAFLVGWIILMIVWYLLGLPLGPSAPLYL